MRAFVTGGTGFSGASLVEHLLRQGHQVTVLSRSGEPGLLEKIDGAELVRGDITRPDSLADALRRADPDEIYHLAARTFVPDAFADAAGFLEVNLMGTVRLLAAIRRHAPGARLLVVGSAGAYGASGGPGRCLREEDPLRPLDPYGASKAAAELWALQEAAHDGLHVVCVRPFGHIGPRQSPRFVAAGLARQLGRIRAGKQAPVLKVGNLEAVREFSDVEDMAAGYVAALARGAAGEVYNLCSGRGMAIRSLLDLLLERAGIQAEVTQDPDRLRPVDVPALVGDPRRSLEALGWQPAIPLEQTVDAILERWGARPRP